MAWFFYLELALDWQPAQQRHLEALPETCPWFGVVTNFPAPLVRDPRDTIIRQFETVGLAIQNTTDRFRDARCEFWTFDKRADLGIQISRPWIEIEGTDEEPGGEQNYTNGEINHNYVKTYTIFADNKK